MKRLILLGIIFFLAVVVALPQDPIDSKKVPAPVLKTFNKKNSKATDLVWTANKVGKATFYTATYMLGTQKMVNTYDAAGKWQEGKSYLDQKQLPSKAIDYLRQEFSGHKFREAFLFQDKNREKHITVFMTRKFRGYEEPFVWEVWFTNLGQYISTFEPNIPDKAVGEDLPPDERFDRQVDKTVDVMAEPAADEKIDKKDLPSITLNYLKNNYDHEWLYKEILIRETPDMGTVYYVVMKKQGYSETWEHYFDFNGNFLKRNRLDQE